jgi:hypothetical protein
MGDPVADLDRGIIGRHAVQIAPEEAAVALVLGTLSVRVAVIRICERECRRHRPPPARP